MEGQAEEVTSYIMRCFPAILANSLATVSHSTIIPSDSQQPQGRIVTIQGKGHITITICTYLAISSLKKKSTPMEVIKKKKKDSIYSQLQVLTPQSQYIYSMW